MLTWLHSIIYVLHTPWWILSSPRVSCNLMWISGEQEDQDKNFSPLIKLLTSLNHKNYKLLLMKMVKKLSNLILISLARSKSSLIMNRCTQLRSVQPFLMLYRMLVVSGTFAWQLVQFLSASLTESRLLRICLGLCIRSVITRRIDSERAKSILDHQEMARLIRLILIKLWMQLDKENPSLCWEQVTCSVHTWGTQFAVVLVTDVSAIGMLSIGLNCLMQASEDLRKSLILWRFYLLCANKRSFWGLVWTNLRLIWSSCRRYTISRLRVQMMNSIQYNLRLKTCL